MAQNPTRDIYCAGLLQNLFFFFDFGLRPSTRAPRTCTVAPQMRIRRPAHTLGFSRFSTEKSPPAKMHAIAHTHATTQEQVSIVFCQDRNLRQMSWHYIVGLAVSYHVALCAKSKFQAMTDQQRGNHDDCYGKPFLNSSV